MLEKLCGPVILYIGFCLIHIIVDLFQNHPKAALTKTLIMIVLGIVLQLLCNMGMSVISWIIVFVPFIMFTYITAIIMFVFGINPDVEDVCKKANLEIHK